MSVREKPNITEVIGQYISLGRVGKNLRALCPLHTERHPSFFVNPQKQKFVCYGCGAHGDVIDFVMRIENLSFVDACKNLGIWQKPTKRSLIQKRKKELKEKFDQWCLSYYSELCSLLRCLWKAKAKCKTIEDVERIAEFYHAESEWFSQVEILQSGDDELKFELYNEVCT